MKFWFFIPLLFISTYSFNQIDKLVYGKEYVNNKKEGFNGFIGENNLALFGVDYLNISQKKYDLIINKYYKTDLSLVESKNIYSNPLNGFSNLPVEMFYENELFYLFSKFINKKDNITFIGLSILNENTVPVSFEIIDTIEQNSQTEISIKQSEDKKSFILIQNHTHKVANRQVLELKTFDLSGHLIWNKDLLSTNSVHQLEIEKIIYTGNETFILCNYGMNTNQLNSVTTVLSNKYTLWVYNKDLNFMKEIELRLKMKWINGVSIARNFNKELIISGFVNTSRNFGINAVFNVLLNQKYEVSSINYYPFAKSDYSKFITAKALEKSTYLPDFYLKKLMVMADGSYYLIGENFHKYIERNYDPRTNITTTTEHFIYGNIMVCYFDNTAKLKWIDNVPKSQNSINDFGVFSSFTWINLNNKLALFYNDNEKNIDIPINDYFNQKELFNYRRHMHAYVLIDEEGVKKRGKLNQEKTGYLLYPKRSFSINNHTMYLFSDFGRRSKIISVSFK
jgi:hypothetical protein